VKMTKTNCMQHLTSMLLAGVVALLLAAGLLLLLARFQVLAQPAAEVTELLTQKTVDRTVAAPGDILTYTIKIQETGPPVDIWMTDTLPSELNYVTGSLQMYGPGTADVTDQTITWSASGLSYSQTVFITFSAQISPGLTSAEIVNTAQLTGTGALIEFSSEKTTVVTAIGNLDNENTYKTVTPQEQIEPGDNLTYTIRLTNDSEDPVPGVQVVDELPAGLSLMTDSITAVAGSYDARDDVITWTLDMEGYWGNIDLVFEAEILPYEGWITNTAKVTALGHQPLTLTAPGVNVYQGHPYLEVSKSVYPNQARPGEYLTYTVRIVNTGDGVAETVWMTDELPSEVIYQTGTASLGSFSETDGVITWNASPGSSGTAVLPAQGQAALTFTVQISPELNTNVQFINTAVVTGAGTLVQAQVSARATVSVQLYLPLLFKRSPPIPYEPILLDIDNPDQSADYTVSWWYDYDVPVYNYQLQEATNARFTTNLVEYNLGTSTSYDFADKDNGTYYYRVRGQNAYGTGPWSKTKLTTVYVFSYFDDFSNYKSGWPRMWDKTRGALYQVHPYEHPKCPGSDCEYDNGDGYVIARRAGSPPYARFGPGVTVSSADYEIKVDARWWDAQYHATYNIFFGSDSSFANYYSVDVLIDDPSVLPSHCSYRLYRHDDTGDHILRDWRVSSAINCKVRSQDSDAPWNHWRIRRENNWITLYVNNTELGSWYDSRFGANRYFGVGCTLYEGLTPSKPEFDDFSVESIR
jgi:uncharacterized repeat protein (TIGR01451 family)